MCVGTTCPGGPQGGGTDPGKGLWCGWWRGGGVWSGSVEGVCGVGVVLLGSFVCVRCGSSWRDMLLTMDQDMRGGMWHMLHNVTCMSHVCHMIALCGVA